MRRLAAGVLLAATAGLGGCLAPRHERPQAPVPATYAVDDAGDAAAGTPAPGLAWRDFIDDPRLEALIGLACPLTVWEDALRGHTDERSFVARVLHAVIFHDFPEWVFTAAYVAFAAVTIATNRVVPMDGWPSRGRP